MQPIPGLPERFKHFFICENRLLFPDEEFIIHMAFPRCFIRFDRGGGMTTDYDAFFHSIADVQWMDGDEVDRRERDRVLRDAWNFLALDERAQEDDLDDLDEDDLNNLR